MILFSAIFSFVLESYLSNSLNGTFFSVLLVLTTLVFLYPMFYKNEKNYFIYAFVIGLLYDIIFTNTLFLNTFVFLTIAIIVRNINLYLVNNFINTFIITNMVIILYLIFTYTFYLITKKVDLNIMVFTLTYLKNIIFNSLYSILFFIFLEKMSVKYKILKVN